MPTNECIPYFEPATRPSGYCTAAVRGKRFVAPSADIPGGPGGTENMRVAEAGDGVAAVAVSCYDGAIDETIPLVRGVAIVPVTAGAAITAGQPVQSDAQGRAVPVSTGIQLGVAVAAQGTVDSDVAIALQL